MTDNEIRETVRKIYDCEFSEESNDYWLDVLERETGILNVSDYIYWCSLVGLDNNCSADEIADKIISDMKNKNHIIIMKPEE